MPLFSSMLGVFPDQTRISLFRSRESAILGLRFRGIPSTFGDRLPSSSGLETPLLQRGLFYILIYVFTKRRSTTGRKEGPCRHPRIPPATPAPATPPPPPPFPFLPKPAASSRCSRPQGSRRDASAGSCAIPSWEGPFPTSTSPAARCGHRPRRRAWRRACASTAPGRSTAPSPC